MAAATLRSRSLLTPQPARAPGIDELIEGYIQTVMSVIAIDKMVKRLSCADATFNMELFRTLNKDDALLQEIFRGLEHGYVKFDMKAHTAHSAHHHYHHQAS